MSKDPFDFGTWFIGASKGGEIVPPRKNSGYRMTCNKDGKIVIREFNNKKSAHQYIKFTSVIPKKSEWQFFLNGIKIVSFWRHPLQWIKWWYIKHFTKQQWVRPKDTLTKTL